MCIFEHCSTNVLTTLCTSQKKKLFQSSESITIDPHLWLFFTTSTRRWHIGLEFEEEEEEVVEEVIEEIEAPPAESAINGLEEEEATHTLETQRETAQTDQLSVSEQEESKRFVITGRGRKRERILYYNDSKRRY